MPVGAYELIRHAKFDLGQNVTAEHELGARHKGASMADIAAILLDFGGDPNSLRSLDYEGPDLLPLCNLDDRAARRQ